MTRKDYQLIASVFKEYKDDNYLARRQWHKLVVVMGYKFYKDNPKFDTAKFYDACEKDK